MSADYTLPALPTQDGVEFRHCPGWLGYCVGDNGSVWSCRRSGPGTIPFRPWRRLKPRPSSFRGNYGQVSLRRAGQTRPRAVHQLVLEAFVGPCPEGLECCHEDGDASNNCLKNLRWDTHKANAADIKRHGRLMQGEGHYRSILNDEKVRQIRQRAAAGERRADLAREFNVHKGTIDHIVQVDTWRHL